MSKKYDYYGNEVPKTKSRAWVNTAIYASVGVIIGGGLVGTATYFLMTNNRNDYKAVDANIGPAVVYSFDSTDPETKLNGPFNFEVVEYKTQYLLDGSDNLSFQDNGYFLGREGIQKLVDRMTTDLVFGPEIMNLKRIYINNQNMTTPGENGIYYPATNEIGINTNNFATRLYNNSGLGFPQHKNFLEDPHAMDYKIELVFQTLFHEYGHHIAHSYMTSSFDNYTTDIFAEYESGRKRDNWNQHFINVFKTSLDYTETEDTGPIAPATLTRDKQQRSIGSVFDAEDLYRVSNGRSKPDYAAAANGVPIDKLAFVSVNDFNADKTIFESINSINVDDLKYLYAMQELSTRKYMQIFYKKNTWTTNLLHGGIPDGVLENETYYETPLLNGGTSDRFLEDNLYGENDLIPSNPAQELYDELKLQMGLDKNISFIWGKNNFYVKDDNTAGDDISDPSNNNMIKVSGYVNDDTITEIGYMDGNNQFQKIDDVSVFSYNFNKKSDLNDLTWEGTPGNQKFDKDIKNHYAWATKNFISTSDYLGKELVFKNSSDAIVNITTARASSESGYASNYLSHLPSLTYQRAKEEQQITGDFYAASEENGKVIIRLKKRLAGV